ncbi:hypothetical protein [Agrobacterium salinitolerans]|uniref:hypothetical protein n=1 Tax=Agrobacterium salinitolerans TaxID=1183413 RepID=UPI0022B844E9|nr:hypothetical protein [Agrobacterium salinitolerans]MCZ7885387.1 hypothetical protein [Agrobacterium salinitolerans]
MRELSDDLRFGHRDYLRQNLDDPTPFTENSLYVVGTPSATPEILVGVKDAQAAYLRYDRHGQEWFIEQIRIEGSPDQEAVWDQLTIHLAHV